MTPQEEIIFLRSEIDALVKIGRAALQALPQNDDPNKRPAIRQLPEEISKIVEELKVLRVLNNKK